VLREYLSKAQQRFVLVVAIVVTIFVSPIRGLLAHESHSYAHYVFWAGLLLVDICVAWLFRGAFRA
jgi:hypothetical protein